VATYAKSGGIVNYRTTTANLLRNIAVKIVNRLRFDRIMDTCLWPHFLAHLGLHIVRLLRFARLLGTHR